MTVIQGESATSITNARAHLDLCVPLIQNATLVIVITTFVRGIVAFLIANVEPVENATSITSVRVSPGQSAHLILIAIAIVVNNYRAILFLNGDWSSVV